MSMQQVASESKRRQRKSAQLIFALINEHAEREFRLVNKAKLVIPTEDYQRDEAGGRIAAEIAQNFDLVAFGCLTVIHSITGHMRVIDGGTRLSAALKREDINEVPCIVYRGLTLKQEAEAFLRINENRRKLQVWQLQHGELAAGRSLALTAQSHLDRLHKEHVNLQSLGVLRRCIKSSDLATATVVDLLLATASGHHVSARVLTGLVTLESYLIRSNKTLRVGRIIARMRRDFSQFDIFVSANVQVSRRLDGRTLARAVGKALGLQGVDALLELPKKKQR